MAKLVLKVEKPLNGYSKVINKLKIDEYQFDSLISLAIPLKRERKCKLNFKKSLGEPMPNIENSIINKSGILGFRLGLDLLFICNPSHSSFAKKTVPLLKQAFYITDQTGGWCGVRVDGDRVIEMLERICPLNLSQKIFAIGDVKRTVMDHLNVIIFRETEKKFILFSPSSSSGSFLKSIEISSRNI